MDNRLLNTGATRLGSWLSRNGYLSLEEWGLDSDFTLVDGVWFNEDGDEIDIWSMAWAIMEDTDEGL